MTAMEPNHPRKSRFKHLQQTICNQLLTMSEKKHLGAAWQARHLFHFVAMFFLSETNMPTLSGGFPWFPWPGHLGS
jgi:hypothetical protein